MKTPLDRVSTFSPLPFGWWLPTAPPYKLQCDSSHYVTLSSNAFGQSNNVLLTLVHTLEYLVLRNPQPMLVLPNWCNEVNNTFDLNSVLDGWVCIAPHHMRHRVKPYILDAKRMYMLGQRQLGEAFTRVVLSQLFLRPRMHIKARFDERIAKYPGAYVAIHLRRLCEMWYPNARSCTNAHNGHELCTMQTDYLNRTLVTSIAMFGQLPLLLMHDHSNDVKDDSRRIVHDFDAIVPSKANVYVDMLTMIRAKYFIGNPASTLSQNVMRVRDELLPDSHARSNMHGCVQTPGSDIKSTESRFVIDRIR